MANTEPNSGIKYGWEKNSGGWGEDLNKNFELIGRLLHHAALGLESTPPASPTLGDIYLVGDSATGDFLGNEGKVAARSASSWDFYEVPNGVLFSLGGAIYELSGGSWAVWSIDVSAIPAGSIVESKLANEVSFKLNNPPVSVGSGITKDPLTNKIRLDDDYIVDLIGYDGRAGLQEVVPDYVDGGLLPVPDNAAKWLKVTLDGVDYSVPAFLLTEL